MAAISASNSARTSGGGPACRTCADGTAAPINADNTTANRNRVMSKYYTGHEVKDAEKTSSDCEIRFPSEIGPV